MAANRFSVLFFFSPPQLVLSAAFYRKKYIQKNLKLKLPDCFIAATCKIYNLKLATLDKKGYQMDDIEIIDRF